MLNQLINYLTNVAKTPTGFVIIGLSVVFIGYLLLKGPSRR